MRETQASALWDSLVASALVGSERQPFTLPAAEGPLAEIAEGLRSRNEPESALLHLAAAVSLYIDAGCVPAKIASPLPASDDDATPQCKPESAWFLDQILSDGQHDLVVEWLSAVNDRQKRVPEEMLPTLLAYGAAHAAVREEIVCVIGKRGLWLAAQNEDWQYAISAESEDSWHTGQKDERLAYIARLRKSDPARALELVRATWDAEPPETRAAILGAFQVGLSADDEPFLEEGLDDRRKEVRRKSAELLARLPESALCRRMTDRIRHLLQWNPGKSGFLGMGRKPQLSVELPKECDKQMARDGIEPKPRQGIGERAWWLMQIVAAVPPSSWCRVWDVSASELINAAMQSEWKAQLLEGWATAARRHHDADLATALLAVLLDPPRDCEVDIKDLMDAIPPQRLEQLIMQSMRTGHAAILLANCKHRWSHELSKVALPLTQKLMSGKAGWQPWQIGHVIVHFAGHISPSLYPDLNVCLSSVLNQDNEWGKLAHKFMSILKFRHDMLEAI